MKSYAILAVALFGVAVSPTIVNAEGGFIEPDAVKWRAFPLADGVQVSALYGGADKEGIYTLRVKMADGAQLKIHTHPDTRMITVLSGKLYAGRGTKVDGANETLVGQNAFFVVPAGSPHYVRAGAGEVIYQENGFGPSPTKLLSD
ncbi:cupin domain-containing protein [Tardiphaga sp. 866_E4_N2_1]|uniref:cupin domain-containing protein n=1 Tax=unclassified Tardiphaga TaxID=2631404 RepID=UPI003F211D07